MKKYITSRKEAASMQRRCSMNRKILIGVALTIVVLGVALGVGLGLTIGRRNSDEAGPSDPSYTSSPLSPPNTTLPWTPRINDTWQITLSQPPLAPVDINSVTPNVTIFDVDLFDTSAETIADFQNLGKKVICYFSGGSFESWRPDAGKFEAADKGKNLDGWPGEKWLNISSERVRSIMKSRLELASGKKCNGVDPDNVDGYDNDNGLNLTQDDSIDFMQFLSSIARPLNLTLGLKNAGSIISAVSPVVDFAVNEQCVQYNECGVYHDFIEAGKPVFHIEYPKGSNSGVETKLVNELCGKDGGDSLSGFSTVLKRMNLDGWVEYCDLEVVTTPLNATAASKSNRI
ncbi:hypothetical protein E8E13_002433 [Curvularia kusanoi]|uniref:alpha-galactosidase n=1 Tax=Curvularia kusanoi TaxID=90978 RepID=A0A9P4T4B1_CURKU|nr:hypothetical protein E8E13_002433 [Curvularia kusanoi]